MAERTVSIAPLHSEASLDQLQLELSGLGVERMALLADQHCAYVQFRSIAEVEALASRYPDCRVPALANAEISLVEAGFKWPAVRQSARAECLVVVQHCGRLAETSETRIRQVFKQFAIEKMAKFEESEQIVIEFHSQDDLQLLDMYFDGLRVPELGPHAEIAVDNAFPVERFLQRYLQRNQIRVVEPATQQPHPQQPSRPHPQSPERKQEESKRSEQDSRRKMEEMEREVERERARKSEAEAIEKARREKEERERVERFAREKREREERERRQLFELQESRRKEEALRKAQQEQQLRRQLEQSRREAEEKQRQEEQQLAARIAAIKIEVQAEQRMLREQQEARVAPVEQGEPELQRILHEAKEQRKREIKLTEINSSDIRPPEPEPQQHRQQSRPESKAQPKPHSQRQAVPKDYSKLPVHFITALALAWIYYVLTR